MKNCKLVNNWNAQDVKERELKAEFRKSKRQAEADLFKAQELLDQAEEKLEKAESARGAEFSTAEIVNCRREVAYLKKDVEDIREVNDEFLNIDK